MAKVTVAIEHLEKSREILFEASRELMASENGDFGRAEAFFELAKKAEDVRNMYGDKPDCSEDVSAPMVPRKTY